MANNTSSTYVYTLGEVNRANVYKTEVLYDIIKRDLRTVYSRAYRDHLRWYGCPDIDKAHLLLAYGITDKQLTEVLNTMEKKEHEGLSHKYRADTSL